MAEKRLIDADAILKKAKPMEELDGDGIPCEVMAVSAILIDDAPTVDAVEVVRCEKCAKCLVDNTGRENHLCMKRPSFPVRVKLDGFCSDVERRSDG